MNLKLLISSKNQIKELISIFRNSNQEIHMLKTRKKKNSSGSFYKLIILGDSGVGKTTLINRYIHECFNETFAPTIGVDFKIKRLNFEGEKMNLQIWDTAGQQKYKNLTKSYFQGCSAVMFAFSLTDQSSYASVSQWIAQLNEIASLNLPKILIATKADDFNERIVTIQQCSQLALEYEIECIQVSSKTGYNVEEAFNSIAKKMIKQESFQSKTSQFKRIGEEFSDEERNEKVEEITKLKLQSSKQGPCFC